MRMRRISEALCGIQVCKLFAWEPDFAAAIGACVYGWMCACVCPCNVRTPLIQR